MWHPSRYTQNVNLLGAFFYVEKYHKCFIKKLVLEDHGGGGGGWGGGGGFTHTYNTCPNIYICIFEMH